MVHPEDPGSLKSLEIHGRVRIRTLLKARAKMLEVALSVLAIKPLEYINELGRLLPHSLNALFGLVFRYYTGIDWRSGDEDDRAKTLRNRPGARPEP